jgi:hypothetical protein
MSALVCGPRRRSAQSETLALIGHAITVDVSAFGPAPLDAATALAVAAAPLVPIDLPVHTFDRWADAAQATTPPAYQPYPPSFAAGAARTAEADAPVAIMVAPVAMAMAKCTVDGDEPADRYCVEPGGDGGGVELSGCGGHYVGGESGGRGGVYAAVSAEAPPAGGRGGGAPPAPALLDALASGHDKCAVAAAWCAAHPAAASLADVVDALGGVRIALERSTVSREDDISSP